MIYGLLVAVPLCARLGLYCSGQSVDCINFKQAEGPMGKVTNIYWITEIHIYPIAGCFIRENPSILMDDLGVPVFYPILDILGNLHILQYDIYIYIHTHLYIKLQMATDTVTTCFDAFSCCIFHRAWHMISFSLPFSSQHQDFHHPLRRWFASTATLWLHWYQCRWFAWFRHSLRDLESQAGSRMEYNKKKELEHQRRTEIISRCREFNENIRKLAMITLKSRTILGCCM